MSTSILKCFSSFKGNVTYCSKSLYKIHYLNCNRNHINNNFKDVRWIRTSISNYKERESEESRLIPREIFDRERKDRDDFIDVITTFQEKLLKTGHVEFIYAALKRMKEFGVHEDLEVYKKLIDVMPKGRFVPTNMLQSEYFYYPRQQECITDLLQQMEDYGVLPDWEMQDQLLSIFGKRGYPVRRYWRMMYWIPKFKNLSPWPIPRPAPKDPFQLAKLAIGRIASVDIRSEITVFKTSELEESTEDTWIVSAQSALQKKLLEHHPPNIPIYIEGAFRIWLRKESIMYFIMRSDPIESRRKPKPIDIDDMSNLHIPFFTPPSKDHVIPKMTIHEQKDGIIYAVAATGTSSKQSLLHWIRSLQDSGNPKLGSIPILFKMTSPIGNVEPVEGLAELETETEPVDVKRINEKSKEIES